MVYKDTKKQRKGYVVIVLPTVKPKKQRSRLRARRTPIRGDRMYRSEDVIWLRA